jgi:GNAT superfamily N-acetyltransferase
MSVTTPETSIRDVQPADLSQLRPLLESWIRDSETGQLITDEVNDTLLAIEGVANGTNQERKYVVAESRDGRVLGIMGMIDANKKLTSLASTSGETHAVELINAFVSPEARGRGIGGLLVKNLVIVARGLAYDEVLVESGPRYKDTGWQFWTSIFGEPVAVHKDAFGPGRDAPVWRKRTGFLSN